MAELARLAVHARTEATRVAAIKEVLDRAYGRAPAGEHFNFAEALKYLDKLSDFQLAELVKTMQECVAVAEARVAKAGSRGNGSA
jgi:hypothetical protein